ncbi:MAG: ATP-dependent DNA ligase [Candidatus Thorarchaeota archaeon]|nr:ATP-dependent DNA ligase [Candidatus Thorarchaeota archaeon]
MTDFADLARTLDEVAATSSRNSKIDLAARFLRLLEPDEILQATLFLGGRVFSETDSRTLNFSWAGVRAALGGVVSFTEDELACHYKGDAGEAVASILEEKTGMKQSVLFPDPLTIMRVGRSLTEIAEAVGKGATRRKQVILSQMLGEATPREARYLVALVLEDLRTGFSEGLLAEGIAKAFGVDSSLVRRAWSFSGDLGFVAKEALENGTIALKKIAIEPFRAVKPMLATPAEDVGEVLLGGGRFAFEFKYDGARVQIHRHGDRVSIFSRRLLDVTESLPDIVALVKDSINGSVYVLDGEVVAVDARGQPYPFQIVMKRFGRTREVEEKREEVGLHLYVFDILLRGSQALVDLPYETRRKTLEEFVPEKLLARQHTPTSIDEAKALFRLSKEMGHEGLVAKQIDSTYTPGARGKAWYKIKHTLDPMDLVIIGAEWGHGRRRKWLSDYHLAVRNDITGSFSMIGKTFKGLTDEEFAEMTQRLLEIKTHERRGYIRVAPKIVVEVLASEIQESPTYESGMALRFARIVSIRTDKNPDDVLTLSELRNLYDSQFKHKSRH